MIKADTDGDAADELVVDFDGLGRWLWNAWGWTQLTGTNVDSVIAADVDSNGRDEVLADVGPLGLWLWNGGWSQLSAVDPTAVAAANTDVDLARELVVDFGRVGIWLFDGGAWSQIRQLGIQPGPAGMSELRMASPY